MPDAAAQNGGAARTLETLGMPGVPNAFISYAHEDKLFVVELVRALREGGVDCFWDEDIRPGESVSQQLQERIDGCDRLLCVISRASIASRWCGMERNVALWAENRRLIPLVLEDVGPAMPPFLRDIKCLDFTDTHQRHQRLRELLGFLKGDPQCRRSRVVLRFEIPYEMFGSREVALIRAAIAGYLQIPLEQISMEKVEKGSVILTLGLPLEHAIRLSEADIARLMPEGLPLSSLRVHLDIEDARRSGPVPTGASLVLDQSMTDSVTPVMDRERRRLDATDSSFADAWSFSDLEQTTPDDASDEDPSAVDGAQSMPAPCEDASGPETPRRWRRHPRLSDTPFDHRRPTAPTTIGPSPFGHREAKVFEEWLESASGEYSLVQGSSGTTARQRHPLCRRRARRVALFRSRRVRRSPTISPGLRGNW